MEASEQDTPNGSLDLGSGSPHYPVVLSSDSEDDCPILVSSDSESSSDESDMELETHEVGESSSDSQNKMNDNKSPRLPKASIIDDQETGWCTCCLGENKTCLDAVRSTTCNPNLTCTHVHIFIINSVCM